MGHSRITMTSNVQLALFPETSTAVNRRFVDPTGKTLVDLLMSTLLFELSVAEISSKSSWRTSSPTGDSKVTLREGQLVNTGGTMSSSSV